MHPPDPTHATSDLIDLRRTTLAQLASLLEGEDDAIAAMANTTALLHAAFGWHWVGFYRVKGEDLVLGPFQGPVACARIAFGKGVCGSAWKEDTTLIVPDVDLFPGHIACSPYSRSEIVVPLRDRNSTVCAVLDVDSTVLHGLNEDDARFLELVGGSIEALLK